MEHMHCQWLFYNRSDLVLEDDLFEIGSTRHLAGLHLVWLSTRLFHHPSFLPSAGTKRPVCRFAGPDTQVSRWLKV